jgi:hypothetical protein
MLQIIDEFYWCLGYNETIHHTLSPPWYKTSYGILGFLAKAICCRKLLGLGF